MYSTVCNLCCLLFKNVFALKRTILSKPTDLNGLTTSPERKLRVPKWQRVPKQPKNMQLLRRWDNDFQMLGSFSLELSMLEKDDVNVMT